MHRDEDDTMKANAHPFSTRRGRRARLSAEAEGALTVPEPDERLVGHDELSPAGLAAADDGVCVLARLKIPRLAARTEQRGGVPHLAWKADVFSVSVRVGHLRGAIVTQPNA